MFPYHYGSYATERIKRLELASKKFPYHYGSYATADKYLIKVMRLLSFHTTMVLTQPLLLQRYYTGFGEAESTNWEDLVSDIEFAFQRFA